MTDANIRNGEEFKSGIEEFAEKFGIDVFTVIKVTALNIFTDLVEETPRDTGRAASSWTIDVGQVDESVQPKPKTKRKLPYKTIASNKGAEFDSKEVEDGDIVYISNSIPYIVPLNNGHSKKAPKFFVEAIVRSWDAYIKQSVKNVSRN